MFACTALSAASLGYPAVITPSKNVPMFQLLLSPPVPRMMPPSCCIGVYPPRLGSAPFHHVVSPPDWALPPFNAYVVWPLFFSIAVTYVLLLPRFAVLAPLPPMNRPFSMSASTHGPDPLHGAKPHAVPRVTASMWPLPVSAGVRSALP